ncbi:50S ribosomal protein L18 [Desulfogranum marinum]|jgi:large subunit ribosomal protein L18|uniref:50S ribosomal protein L18 n=1 Tax=Desulfogranum marinum TaxID=453220 RepID=UPI0019626977|nr:50S ribosomal protein L18 [Desulfogranum marinum]MBM9511190.1 50S ribosomal protein L18 [Desulfogranum marinum]
MAKTNPKVTARYKRVRRIRKNMLGTSEKPRMRVFRSNKHIYVQIIDDLKKATLVSASTENKEFDAADLKGKCEKAKKVGLMVAEKAKAAGIEQVVFDRGGYIYHGRVKALSEGAREGGLKF